MVLTFVHPQTIPFWTLVRNFPYIEYGIVNAIVMHYYLVVTSCSHEFTGALVIVYATVEFLGGEAILFKLLHIVSIDVSEETSVLDIFLYGDLMLLGWTMCESIHVSSLNVAKCNVNFLPIEVSLYLKQS